MSSVVSLVEFKDRYRSPTLVLVDLHEATTGKGSHIDAPALSQALANCRAALVHARATGLPVAFARRVAYESSPWVAQRYPVWLDGFEPKRSDMVFDRPGPSCYASPEFADMMHYTSGNYVIAGLFAETSCLSTVVDAHHRNHRTTYLMDASASRAHDDISAADMHNAVHNIVSLYGTVVSTKAWIRMTSLKIGAKK